ncbi:MAG TPA: MFS transporter [Gaiellaceae bacterium]|nr:MFS transporter [Gaiellaceae bacterium]
MAGSASIRAATRSCLAAERASPSWRDFRAVAIVWSGWVVLMAGANLATPLYELYAERFGFSSLVLTSVFATYAVVLVPGLVVFGRMSDRFGRRPVILAGLSVACAALLVFVFARDAAWLYGARALQGLAVAMISGAATAALVELDPGDDRRRAALLAGLAQAGGGAAGPLLAGALAQWAPAPLRLSFFVGIGATLAAGALTLRLREESDRAREPWRFQRPRVPHALRSRFARVSLTAATVWAAVALYLSIVPSYVGDLLETDNLALLAAISAIALVASCATQILSERRHPSTRLSQAAGLAILATGLLALALGGPSRSLPLLIAGSLLAGAGHGVAFLNAQEELNEMAPADRRGEVTAAFISCIYFLVAGSVVSTGLLDLRFSLSASVDAVSVALVASALAAAVWQVRAESRPQPRERTI